MGSQISAAFHGNPANICQVILVWSKEGDRLADTDGPRSHTATANMAKHINRVRGRAERAAGTFGVFLAVKIQNTDLHTKRTDKCKTSPK